MVLVNRSIIVDYDWVARVVAFGNGAIGVWLQLFEGVAIIACITNCALVGVAGHLEVLFPSFSAVQVVLALVFVEARLIVFLTRTILCLISNENTLALVHMS